VLGGLIRCGRITGNGSVSRGEWTESFVTQFGATSDQALAAFRNLDRTGNGEVSVDQLKRLFSAMDVDGKSRRRRNTFFTPKT